MHHEKQRQPRRLWPLAVRGLAVAGCVIALGPAEVMAAPDATDATLPKPILRIGLERTLFVNLNPGKAGLAGPPELAFEPIVNLRPDGSFAPGLATSWHFMKSKPGSGRRNKDFEFTLRKNARFSDGTPVTASAVKKWLQYFSKTNTVAADYMAPLSSIDTIGRWTVRLHLKSPDSSILLNALSWRNGWAAVSSPVAVNDPERLSSATYGAGPYMLDPSQTVAGNHYTLVPNPYYFNKSRIKWSKVVYRVITNTSSMLQALQAGQIDVAIGDPATAPAAESRGFAVHGSPNITQAFILDVLGGTQKELKDVRVRQAMNYAVNRRAIVSALFGKYAIPSSALGSLDGSWRTYANAYPYNPAKARSLLAAAGYPRGFTINRVITAGWQGTTANDLALAVAQSLKAVGVTLNLVPTDLFPNYVAEAIVSPNPPPMFQWPPPVFPIKILHSLAMVPNARINHLNGGWNDPVLNKFRVQAIRAVDPHPMWKKMTQRITDQAYFLPIAVSQTLFFVNTKKVKNFKLGPGTKVFAVDFEWSPA